MDINKNRFGISDCDYGGRSAKLASSKLLEFSDSNSSEEKMMPQDVDAFYKHPLVAASHVDNGDSIALLHEYQTLYSGMSDRTEDSPSRIFESDNLDLSHKLDMSNVSESSYVNNLDITLNSNVVLDRCMTDFSFESSLLSPNSQTLNGISENGKDFSFYKTDDNFDSNANLISDSFLSSIKLISQQQDDGVLKLNSLSPEILPSINILSRSSAVEASSIHSPFMTSPNQSWKEEMAKRVTENERANQKMNAKQQQHQEAFLKNTFNFMEGLKMNNPLLACDEVNNLRLQSSLPPLSLLNKSLPSSGRISSSRAEASIPQHLDVSHIVASSSSMHSSVHNSSSFESMLLLRQASSSGESSSAIDMSYSSSSASQAGIQAPKSVSNSTTDKFQTSRTFFGNSDLIRVLEKQLSSEPSAGSLTVKSVLSTAADSQKSNHGLPSLPFPLPAVPPGYRLVITHLPITNDQEPDSKHITQLIIDNPVTQSPSLKANINHQPLFFSQSQSALQTPSNQINMTKRILSNKMENAVNSLSTTTTTTPATAPIAATLMHGDILSKSIEEANILPLFHKQNLSNLKKQLRQTDFNSEVDLSFLQKDLNASKSEWQSTVNIDDVHSSVYSTSTSQESTNRPAGRSPYRGKGQTSRWSHVSFISKVDPDTSGFEFFLEAPISIHPRKDEDRVTYLNKSQYYTLVLRHRPPVSEFSRGFNTNKSIVMLVFRERLAVPEELKSWDCWYSRQHSYKQRVLDIDSKNSSTSEEFMSPLLIEEVAHNAVAVIWNRNSSVKLNLALNCLSTDFSHQKGIRGNPLHIQIDTYENDNSTMLSHRAYCQIKVFCDKGADRKAREEERKRAKHPEDTEHQEPCERSFFYSMADLKTPPVLFYPPQFSSIHSKGSSELNVRSSFNVTSKRSNLDAFDDIEDEKRRRLTEQERDDDARKLLIYVREECDTVFNALVVQPPTLFCLSQAIREKFLNSNSFIGAIYKESRNKDIVLKVDDIIVANIPSESTFIISFRTASKTHPANNNNSESFSSCDIVLTEIRVQS